MYGPLTVQERIDHAGAEAAWAAARAGGAQAPLEKFLPRWDQAATEDDRQSPGDLIAFMRSLQGGSRKRKRRPRKG